MRLVGLSLWTQHAGLQLTTTKLPPKDFLQWTLTVEPMEVYPKDTSICLYLLAAYPVLAILYPVNDLFKTSALIRKWSQYQKLHYTLHWSFSLSSYDMMQHAPNCCCVRFEEYCCPCAMQLSLKSVLPTALGSCISGIYSDNLALSKPCSNRGPLSPIPFPSAVPSISIAVKSISALAVTMVTMVKHINCIRNIFSSCVISQ